MLTKPESRLLHLPALPKLQKEQSPKLTKLLGSENSYPSKYPKDMQAPPIKFIPAPKIAQFSDIIQNFLSVIIRINLRL
jgi:hypothetical protein